MNIIIVRMKASLQYKFRMGRPDSWENNKANNSLDQFWLFDGSNTLFACKVQTVSNLPGGRVTDSVAPGKFKLRLFVEPRDFWCQPHGIIDAYDLDGQYIDKSSVETVPGKDDSPISMDRWLMHDWQKHRSSSPKGSDTSVAWSLGCFVVPTAEFARFNALLAANGLKKDDEIEGELRMQIA